MFASSFPTALIALALCAGASAQSPLSTVNPFASNNSGAVGGGVYFDLTASAASGVLITGFDINSSAAAGVAVTIDVYWRGGSHVGLGGSPAGWILHGSSAAGVTAGRELPTSLTLITPMCVPAGATIGVAIALNGAGHAYTNGPLGPYSNADLTWTGGQASNTALSGGLFSPRIANLNIYYTLGSCSLYAPAGLVGVAEQTPNSGNLSTIGAAFGDGHTLRWNFVDPVNANTGLPAVVVLNIGRGGSAPIGSTPAIPGFTQEWFGSVVPGLAWFYPTVLIGGADTLTRVPPGLFTPGDTLRVQGLVLDAVHAPGVFPLVPTEGSIEFTHKKFCPYEEFFDGTPTGLNYPAGWSRAGGDEQWRVRTRGTPSGTTGPSGASSGSNYMYTETSGGATPAKTFIMNSASYATNALVANTLKFQLSRIGAQIGTLEVRMGDGGGTFPTVLATYTGPTAGQWNLQTLALGAGLPANIQFQFHYTSGTNFTGDLAIDSICIE